MGRRLTGKNFASVFKMARQAEVKVELPGEMVPVTGVYYDELSDSYVIQIDEESEDFSFARYKHLNQRYDHEHPCPSAECIEAMQRWGEKVPDGVDCCICWQQEVDGVMPDGRPITQPQPVPAPPQPGKDDS